MTDVLLICSLINRWTWSDKSGCHSCLTSALLSTCTRARRTAACVRRERERSQQMWLCIKFVPFNKSIQQKKKKTAMTAEDAVSVFRTAPRLFGITFLNNFSGRVRVKHGRTQTLSLSLIKFTETSASIKNISWWSSTVQLSNNIT